MDLLTLELLLSPIGTAAVDAAAGLDPDLARFPANVDRLAKRFPRPLARAALETVQLRKKGAVKFARAEAMYFLREALEMASAEPISRYRAERFIPFRTVADLGCGLGGDTLGPAAAGRQVVAIERDPVLLRMAAANLAAYELEAQFVPGDLLTAELPTIEAAFADPGRRPGGRRTASIAECDPPVREIVARFPRGFPLAIKVAPGLPRAELQSLDSLEADPEFIALAGELRECTLNFGPLRFHAARATILPGPHTLVGNPALLPERAPIMRYLLDPNPAVSRSGLLGELAVRLAAFAIDDGIGFLTADIAMPTPFGTWYEVIEVLPSHARTIRNWLRTHSIGRVTAVKLNSTADLEKWQATWPREGSGHRCILFAKADGREVAIIVDRLSLHSEQCG